MVVPPRLKPVWKPLGPLLAVLTLGGLITLGLVFASTTWASRQTNFAALERQRELVDSRLETQLANSAEELSLVAEGFANAVGRLANTPGPETFSGETFTDIATSIFKYDGAFVITEHGELALGRDGESNARFEWIKPLILPILRRAVQAARDEESLDPASKSAEVVELMRLQGRPSIAGVVPIRGNPEQSKEPALFLFAYRYLDGRSLDALSQEQGLNGARFARSADPGPDEVTFQIEATVDKKPIGFIIWTPDLPGSKVVAGLIPALIVAALIIAALVAALVMLLRKSWADLRSSEQDARHRSLHDILTNLPNRGLFGERLASRLGTHRAGCHPVIALIDLDKFKTVNDTLGHAAGDEIIRAAAARITALLGKHDTLARLGGDEFALLLVDIPDGDISYRALFDKIVDSLAQPFVILNGQATAQIGASIGILSVPKGFTNAGEAMHLADLALYEAKASGRGRHVEYENTMDAGIKHKEALKADLRASVEAASGLQTAKSSHGGEAGSSNKIEVFYQTIHRTDAGYPVSGAEALVRWRHDKYGLLTPDRFIPLAEDSGLILPLGKLVLEQACLAALHWPAEMTVSVNVSPIQLRTPGFADEVLQVLVQTGLSPTRLEIEVTETALMGGEEHTVNSALQLLRGSGVKIALDDFGTGYSSLSHLIKFGIDRIKIDRSFVCLLGSRSDGAAIVSAVVALSHGLGLATTAEGVETAGQRDFLVAAGCSHLQGFLFSKPTAIPEIGIDLDIQRNRAV